MNGKEITWEGPEYIVPKRGAWWYAVAVVLGLGVVALGVWLQQWTLVALVVVVMIAVIMRGTVKPRMVKYVLSTDGVKEGEKLRAFAEFKAFGVLRQEGNFYISLRPAKRFGMRMNVVIPGEQGEGIVDALGAHLPMEEVKEDLIDKLVKILKI
jgi:type II secretory pathway component PulF